MPPHGPHGPHGAGSKEKPKEGKKTLIRLVKRLGPSRFLLIAVFIFACVDCALCRQFFMLVYLSVHYGAGNAKRDLWLATRYEGKA